MNVYTCIDIISWWATGRMLKTTRGIEKRHLRGKCVPLNSMCERLLSKVTVRRRKFPSCAISSRTTDRV